jgi:hypothetical protein
MKQPHAGKCQSLHLRVSNRDVRKDIFEVKISMDSKRQSVINQHIRTVESGFLGRPNARQQFKSMEFGINRG